MLSIRPVLLDGVYHWTAAHPDWEGPVSAYAIDDGERLILIDPIAVPDDVRALFGSREVVTVLTSTWHERDAASLAPRGKVLRDSNAAGYWMYELADLAGKTPIDFEGALVDPPAKYVESLAEMNRAIREAP